MSGRLVHPEKFLEFGLVFSFKEGQALLFEAEAAGDDVAEEGANLAEFGFVVFGDGGGLGGGGETGGNPVGEVVDEGRCDRDLVREGRRRRLLRRFTAATHG